MRYLPEAYENIIVGLKWKEQFTWYVSVKEDWFLNETELQEDYRQCCNDKGASDFTASQEDEQQEFLPINEEIVNSFLSRISTYAASTQELREYLKLALEIDSEEDVFYEYMPTLYIDLDKRILYSMYTEPASFEDYVPGGWKGYLQTFLDLIVPDARYWYENGMEFFSFRRGQRFNGSC